MRIAVLGPNGQIGSFLVKWLLARQVGEVVSVVRNQAAKQSLEGTASELRVGAVTDPSTCQRLLSDCDVVVNCAWPGGLPRTAREQSEAIARNVLGLANIKQYITLSSVAVYGAILDGRATSFKKPVPCNSYGRLKLGLEAFVENSAKKSSADVIIFRLGHVYGPHQWASRFVADFLEDQCFKLPFNGERDSNSIHINEFCAAIESVIRKSPGSKIFNLSSFPQRTWKEIFDWHSSTLGLPVVSSLDMTRSTQDLCALFKTTDGGVFSDFIRSVSGSLAAFFSGILGEPQVKEVALFLLNSLPERVGRRTKLFYTVRRARKDIAMAATQQIAPALFFFRAMPGEYLHFEMPTGRSVYLEESSKEQLREWFMQTRTPGLILEDTVNVAA